jgi:cation diffusion facilitator family transporter
MTISKQGENDEKAATARLSVISNALLVFLKLIVGLALGSVSMISEAIHSGMDLVASVIAFVSVRKSAEPADDEHAFGHGKFESVSGLAESLLIFVAAILIIIEAVIQLLEPTGEGLDPNLMFAGMAVMAISAVVNWAVSARLMTVAKKTESIALESDAWHLRTDVYTSVGVFVGLVLIQITGIVALDSIVAIGVALIIMRAAYDLTAKSYRDLVDHRLTDGEDGRIRQIICEHQSEYVRYHTLRTRRSGPEIFIDFSLVVDRDVSIELSHDLTDHLEADLKTEFPRASVLIHVEPDSGSTAEPASFCEIVPKRVPGEGAD